MTAASDHEARAQAAAALRRLGHAIVGHDVDPELLGRIAAQAAATAEVVEQGAHRRRVISQLKRQMWEHLPADGEPMNHYDDCVVSGDANPLGVAISVVREGDVALARFTLGAGFEGAPGRAHGGIVAAILDDVMGYVLALQRTPAYTGRLTISYRAPVPLREELEARAQMDRREGRKLFLSGRITAGDAVLAEGEALFIVVPAEPFLAKNQTTSASGVVSSNPA